MLSALGMTIYQFNNCPFLPPCIAVATGMAVLSCMRAPLRTASQPLLRCTPSVTFATRTSSSFLVSVPTCTLTASPSSWSESSRNTHPYSFSAGVRLLPLTSLLAYPCTIPVQNVLCRQQLGLQPHPSHLLH